MSARLASLTKWTGSSLLMAISLLLHTQSLNLLRNTCIFVAVIRKSFQAPLCKCSRMSSHLVLSQLKLHEVAAQGR